MTWAAERAALRTHDDVALRLARGLLYTSVFLSSILVLRIGDYTAGDLILGGSIGLTLFATAVAARVSRAPMPIACLVIMTAIAGGGLISCLRAQSTASTISVIVRLLAVVILLPWLATVLLTNRDRLRRALLAFAAGCGLCGYGTILQFFFGSSVIPNSAITNAGRFAGLTQNVSDTGGVCCAGMVLGIALLVTDTRGRSRVLALVSALGAAFGLLLSGSVSGLIGTAIGLFVLGTAGVLKPRAIILIAVLFALVLVIVVFIQGQTGALTPLQRILRTTGLAPNDRYNTSDSRLSTYTEAVGKFFANPLIGNGLDPSSTIADGTYPAHNLFIGSAFEGGLLLLFGVTMAVVRQFFGGGLSQMRHNRMVGIAAATVFTELIFAMTAPSLYNRYLWIPIALLIAIRRHIVTRDDPDNGHEGVERQLDDEERAIDEHGDGDEDGDASEEPVEAGVSWARAGDLTSPAYGKHRRRRYGVYRS